MTGRLRGPIADGLQHADNLVWEPIGAELLAAAVAMPAAPVMRQVVPKRRDAIAAKLQERLYLFNAPGHRNVICRAKISHPQAVHDADTALVRLSEFLGLACVLAADGLDEHAQKGTRS